MRNECVQMHYNAHMRRYLQLVAFPHTVFALPFALIGMLVAAEGMPSWRVLLLIVVCMVTARNAAMAFNRLVDRNIDAANPRTAGRHLPKGLMRPMAVGGFVVLNAGLFLLAAWGINRLAFGLAPVALGLVLLYSYTKRFTWLSHWVLGTCLAIAPIGAWVAVTGRIGLPGVVLACAVAPWVAGFDILYSLQDMAFDRGRGLHSVPARWGLGKALWISRGSHVLCVAAFALFGVSAGLSALYFWGLGAISLILTCQHFLVRRGDLAKIGTAFFTVNGWVSVSMLAVVAIDLTIGR